MTRHFIILLAFAFIAVPAHAQDKKVEDKKPVVEKPVEKEEGKDVPAPLKKWIDAENKMIAPLKDEDKDSIYILRNKYSTIRVIGIVKRDIGKAVVACGKENPDIKKQMEDRFAQWKNAVDPIIKTAEKQLNTDIDSQKIVAPKTFRSVMKLNVKAFEYTDGQIEKTPVSTKDACEDLLESMNDTEDNMIKLLRQTLLPDGVIKTRSKAEEKSEEKLTKTKPE